MPKTAIFTKEQVIAAALNLIREQGEQALTTRTLGAHIGCSTSPLFKLFGSKEALMDEIHKGAIEYFDEFTKDAVNYIPAFKEYGLRLVRFAKKEPSIFKFALFSRRGNLEYFKPGALKCMSSMKEFYGLSDEQIDIIIEQNWTFSCGLVMMILAHSEDYSEEQISEMLSRQFIGTLMSVKSGLKVDNVTPRLRKEGESTTLPLPDNFQ